MSITVDKDLAVTALSVIETRPERWDQGSWREDFNNPDRPIEDFHDDPLDDQCGTAFCMAGWVAALDRAKWAGRLTSVGRNNYRFDMYGDRVADPDRCTCPPQRPFCTCENTMLVSEYAQMRLGLTVDEADALFNGDNQIEDLRAGVKALLNGEDVDTAVSTSRWGRDDDYEEDDE